MNLLIAAANPIEHAVAHRLHEHWLIRMPFSLFGKDVPALNIKDGNYDFYITNHLMMTAVVGVLLVLVATFAASRISASRGKGLERFQTKGRIAQLFETICAFIRDEVAAPNLHGLTDKYIYYIWTVFFFILFANVLGVIPIGYILQLITGDSHFSHWGGSATGNLSLTMGLALLSLIAIMYIGITETSPQAFFNHFNPIGWEDKKMLPISLMLYVLEWFSLFVKCFVLAMRLFGTMMAGHLVLAAFVGLIFAARTAVGDGAAFAVSVPVVLVGTALTLLELFICFLQAFIFTFLTVLFISATAVHEHDEHLDHDPDALNDSHQTDPDKILDPGRLGPAV
jgi:F-type H+-transporting ATPase subunit a